MTNSLQTILDETPNFIEAARNRPAGATTFPVVPAEFSNWRDEQLAWKNSVALLDLSHHMTYEYMSGPDIRRLLESLAVNSFSTFGTDKAKQLVCCAPDGKLIGDGILFGLADDEVLYAGRPILANWIRYNAETGGYDVSFRRDHRSPSEPMGRKVERTLYRYQIQGPRAGELIAKLNGGKMTEIRFFNMGHIEIAGRPVRCLRHGMADAPGLEVWGPYEEWEIIRKAILDAGAEFGIVPVGARAYASTPFSSGWIPSAIPAIYSATELQSYREWLSGDGYEAKIAIGGSFVPPKVEDYYATPFELGYGHFVKFDHDFIGRDALERIDPALQRRKVTFEWNSRDVGLIQSSLFNVDELPFKYIEMPRSNYSSHDYDLVSSTGGRSVGVSMCVGFDNNHRSMLSLGLLDPSVALGDEVSILWGEAGGGTRKKTVERHRQTSVRATVRDVPYAGRAGARAPVQAG